MRLTGIAFCFAATLAAQTPADFSGVWKMDVSRSESAHQAAPTGPVTLIIKQTGDQISIETRTGERDKAVIANETLTFRLDGTEGTVTGNAGAQVTCKAHWDGSKLVTQTNRNIHDSTVSTRFTLGLDPNGKELTVEKTLTVQHGYQDPGPGNNTGSAKDVYTKTRAPR